MPCDSPIASVATRSNQEGTMRSLIGAALAAGVAFGASAAFAADSQAERGKYLVTIAGCNDCHKPGYFLGKPDFSRALSGSDVGFTIPGFGAFIGRNLTPDEDTGLGNWTDEQIITAFTKGVRPDGRQLAPIMPWQELAALSPDDAKAIVAYLRTLPPVKHAIPGPFGPHDTPSSLVFVIVPGDVYGKLPKP
jgi:mono/diheme cytochrome c family protein